MKKLTFITIMLILVSIFMHSYPSGASNPPNPQVGGSLKVLANVAGKVLGYPPKIFPPATVRIVEPALERLLTIDSEGNTQPWLATGWKFSPDFKSLDLTLRQGVKFHDGAAFNAKAVKRNLDVFKSSGNAELKAVISVDVINDYTVRLNLNEFDSGLVANLSIGLAGLIVSPGAIDKGIEYTSTHPIGTGPFKLISLEKDVSIKYEKNPEYWRKGEPYLDTLEFLFISDPITAIAAFKNGDADVYQGVSNYDVATHFSQQKEKYNVISHSTGVKGFAADSAHPDSPFSKLKVRQAVQHSIDTEAFAKTLGYGFYNAANQLVSKFNKAYNPNVIGYSYNPDKAKQLLVEAGYPNGFKTKIIGIPPLKKEMTVLQGMFKAVNIDAQIDIVQVPALIETHLQGWQNSLIYAPIPQELGADALTSIKRYLISSTYSSIYYPDEYNTKLAQAAAETDSGKQVVMLHELAKIAIDEYCMYTPIYEQDMPLIMYSNVHNVTTHIHSYRDVWKSKE